MHHAEEAGGIHARDVVVDVGDHQLGGGRGLRAPRGLRVVAAGAQVVEDPGVVAGFLGDVLGDRIAQRGALVAEPAAARHEERHGVLHVVIGLAQEGDVARARDAAGEAVGDRRDREQLGALGGGAALQLVKKAIEALSIGFPQRLAAARAVGGGESVLRVKGASARSQAPICA